LEKAGLPTNAPELGADRYLEKGEPLDVIRDAVREVALAA